MPDPYVPIRDYAVVGDGRTAALVSRGGSVDWWCLPNLDSPSVFGAILDASRGGRWVLGPEDPAQADRRYVADTNVLETTYATATGRVRVTDVMTLPGPGLAPSRELARRVEGLDGRVAMRWRIEPRFGYGLGRTRIESRTPFPVATSGSTALAACAWEAGRIDIDAGGGAGRFEARAGTRATLAVVAAYGEPLIFPSRDDVERRIEATAAFWRDWSARLTYQGPWRDAVVRSALALKLLVFAPSARSRRLRPPRCRRRSGASGTGTTASRGSATPPSRSSRCCSSGARPRRGHSSGGSWVTPSKEHGVSTS